MMQSSSQPRPVIKLQSSRPVALKKALKQIRKFTENHNEDTANLSLTNRERKVTVPEDVLSKLSIMTQSIEATLNADGGEVKKKKKKRKSDALKVSADQSPEKETPKKKLKKSLKMSK